MINATDFLTKYANADVGPFAGASYMGKVLATAPANLIGYWPLNELSGTNADNAEGTAARDGTYTGVSLNNSTGPDGQPVGLWDGANDYCNIYSASLATAFNVAEGTAMIWAKVSGVGVWTDGTARYALTLRTNSQNRVTIFKHSVDNWFYVRYEADNVDLITTITPFSSTGWVLYGVTWSALADEVKVYVNGLQSGATLTGLGTWSGSLDSDYVSIGSQTATTSVWDGYLAHAAVWTTPLSAAQILALATV